LDNKLNFGLIGCGRISKNHIEAIKNLSDRCRLVAVCDSVEKRAAEAAESAGAEMYTNIDKMLARDDINIVSVATPSGLHPMHAKMVAEAGKHCVLEKPIGTSLKDVDAMIRAFDQSGSQLFVVKQNRLNTTMQLLKKAVDKGRFGRIFFAQTNVFWTRGQDYYDQAKWRGTWEFDGGAFLNQASHYVDAIHWLIGEVESVQAFTGTLARQIEAEDSGAAVLRFRNGAIGSINVTMLTYPKNLEGSITIIGEKGTVKVGGVAINKIEKWEFDEYDDDDKLVQQSNYTPPNVYGFGHLAYYDKVVTALTSDSEPDIDGRGGRKSLELVLAIYKSAREGNRVALPLQSN
jgi:UDP-N-acetyl-2-amino-2-deoxyglucuronate dehydrogenase